MAEITRSEIAIRIGISRQNLDAKIRHGWSDFPAPVKKIGRASFYDAEIAIFYCTEKMISDLTKAKGKTGPKIGRPINKTVYNYNKLTMLNMRIV